MKNKMRKFILPGSSFFGGILMVAVLGGFFSPIQNDLLHAVGMLTIDGGSARHPVHMVLGEGLFGRFTLFITGVVIPPAQGDIEVEVHGPEDLEYTVSSRYPPSIPLLNRGHEWFTFEDGVHRGVQMGDSLILVMQIKPPSEPGEYEIILKEPNRSTVFLTLPAFFEMPAGVAAAEESCH